MPEGHTLHRYARLHRLALVGRRVRAWSPQGRFTAGAAVLDGLECADVEAYGKHLFYRWRDGRTGAGHPSCLHIHLGLFGLFRSFEGAPPAPTDGTRLALRAGDTTLYLAGATACELIDEAQEDRLRARLGPDPLDPAADPERAWAATRQRRAPIGQVLLDQRVIAGIGNVYRAESLFVCGIDPRRPVSRLDRGEFDRLWHTLVRMLRAGERTGRIVTLEAADRDRPPSRIARGDAHYVYRRGGLACRRCAAPIESWELGGRVISACPVCQPG